MSIKQRISNFIDTPGDFLENVEHKLKDCYPFWKWILDAVMNHENPINKINSLIDHLMYRGASIDQISVCVSLLLYGARDQYEPQNAWIVVSPSEKEVYLVENTSPYDGWRQHHIDDILYVPDQNLDFDTGTTSRPSTARPSTPALFGSYKPLMLEEDSVVSHDEPFDIECDSREDLTMTFKQFQHDRLPPRTVCVGYYGKLFLVTRMDDRNNIDSFRIWSVGPFDMKLDVDGIFATNVEPAPDDDVRIKNKRDSRIHRRSLYTGIERNEMLRSAIEITPYALGDIRPDISRIINLFPGYIADIMSDETFKRQDIQDIRKIITDYKNIVVCGDNDLNIGNFNRWLKSLVNKGTTDQKVMVCVDKGKGGGRIKLFIDLLNLILHPSMIKQQPKKIKSPARLMVYTRLSRRGLLEAVDDFKHVSSLHRPHACIYVNDNFNIQDSSHFALVPQSHPDHEKRFKAVSNIQLARVLAKMLSGTSNQK